MKMKEPNFAVGDIVYDKDGLELCITEIRYFAIPADLDGFEVYYHPEELSKEKPLKKITVEELAKMGYELKGEER